MTNTDTKAPPAPGDERVTLEAPTTPGGTRPLHRYVWSAAVGETTFYDDSILDWITWRGSWVLVEVLGEFDGKDDARRFMLDRQAERNASGA